MKHPLVDPYNRAITYLRMSVTDRCNYKCVYCLPEGGYSDLGRYNLLTLEELARIGRVFVEEGIRKIRLTGGEPLLRKDLHILIRRLNEIEDLRDLCLTTNGHLLADQAEILAESGLQRINVSLDSLIPHKFKAITRGGDLSRVLEGLRRARNVFLGPVKINVVAMRGFNEDEIMDFARLTIEPGYHVRFIEPMPMSTQASWEKGKVIPIWILRERIAAELGLEILDRDVSRSGPAVGYRIPGARGELGFIGAVTDEFCETCNRIRLTPDGKLRGCLLADGEIDLRAILRSGGSDADLRQNLAELLRAKPQRHTIHDLHFIRPQRTMSQIGG